MTLFQELFYLLGTIWLLIQLVAWIKSQFRKGGKL